VIGNNANLGANAPNYAFPIPVVFGIEAFAYTKGLKGLSGIAIGGIVGLHIFFMSFISGASMNPARALVPALLSGKVSLLADLWVYWSATFVGTSIVAIILRNKFANH